MITKVSGTCLIIGKTYSSEIPLNNIFIIRREYKPEVVGNIK